MLKKEDVTCPITHQNFRKPVIACDGIFYEESAIKQWLSSHNTSPMTGLPIEKNTIVCIFF